MLRQQVLMDASADSFIFVWQRRLIDCRGADGVLPPQAYIMNTSGRLLERTGWSFALPQAEIDVIWSLG
jgi:hypothetical protein